MLIPCVKSEKHCFPCAGDSSNPLANLSIEPFDTNIWLSVYFGGVVNPVPNSWTTLACAGFCESAISQVDADDCARRRALECLPDPPDPPRPPPPDPPPPPFSNHTFCNEAVTCQSGSDCYTVPECTVLGNTVAEANALAQSICNSRVLDSGLSSPCGDAPPPSLPPAPSCPQESGVAAPDMLEIAVPSDWGSFTYAATNAWPASPTYNVMELAKDHPPGEYRMDTTGGFRYRTSSPLLDCDLLCDPCTAAMRHLEGLWDDSNNITVGGNYLTDSNTKNFNAACYNSVAEAAVTYNSETFTWPIGNSHSNTKSPFYVATDTNYVWNLNSGPAPYFSQALSSETVFSIIQESGLIPQPRKLLISAYYPVQFADPTGAASWNGAFNTRDFYTAVGLRWIAPASGSFGGAQLEYTMSHPTSASGKGWMLSIYSPGLILMWRGFKAVGNTSIGRYYKDSTSTPIGPACLTCADTSEDVWYPGEAPP